MPTDAHFDRYFGVRTVVMTIQYIQGQYYHIQRGVPLTAETDSPMKIKKIYIVHP